MKPKFMPRVHANLFTFPLTSVNTYKKSGYKNFPLNLVHQICILLSY